MKKVSDYFGCKVFDDRVMKARLSSKVYQSLRKTIDEGAKLDISVANAVAAAMKDQVSPEVKNKRSDVLLELAERGKKAYEAKYEGAELEVLVEEVLHREDGTYLRGHTERYMDILIKAGDIPMPESFVNSFVYVRYTQNGDILMV